MSPPKSPPGPKGRQGGRSASRGSRAGRNRLTGRKIVALGILIVLPLVVIAGVLGSIGSGSGSGSTGPGTAASGAPPGLDLMTQACAQLSTLAQNAGAIAGTGTTGSTASTVTGGGGTTTSGDNAAATTKLLAQMQQVAQLAANAAATSSAWQPMASDIGKLNDMIQADTGNAAGFSAQLDTVGQECAAVVGSTASTPASG